MLLFGISFIYGVAGSTTYSGIATAVAGAPRISTSRC